MRPNARKRRLNKRDVNKRRENVKDARLRFGNVKNVSGNNARTRNARQRLRQRLQKRRVNADNESTKRRRRRRGAVYTRSRTPKNVLRASLACMSSSDSPSGREFLSCHVSDSEFTFMIVLVRLEADRRTTARLPLLLHAKPRVIRVHHRMEEHVSLTFT